MPTKKKTTQPLTDSRNRLGQLYASALRLRARAVLASGTIPLTDASRRAIAADLSALAVIAEELPQAFGALLDKGTAG